MDKFNSSATAYILRFRKNRFMNKPELYFACFLHCPTVARCLSSEECKDLVIKIARASNFHTYLDYDDVEPLIKRVSRDEREAFKKRVFVDRDIGEFVTEWPYALPSAPTARCSDSDGPHVFHDMKFEPIYLEEKSYISISMDSMMDANLACQQSICLKGYQNKSELQNLFDEFRYVAFAGTLKELKLRIPAARSADTRRNMLLVLVSKSAGRVDAVRAVLQIALELRNEPVHERAAVVRSLVKRAHAWRLPNDAWDAMLEYAQGLGLDGSKPKATCREGLHAVVLRQLLESGDCEPTMRTALLNDFSTLAEYNLVQSERAKIAAGLQHLLVTTATEGESRQVAERLHQLIDVLEQYNISLKSSPVVSLTAALVERDFEAAKSLLARLYEARVGRCELFRHNLKFRRDDAALINVLRHDTSAITPEEVVNLLKDGESRASQYLTKLGVYFNETGGMAEQMRSLLRQKIAHDPDVKLARP